MSRVKHTRRRPFPGTCYVSTHTPSPSERLSRSQSTPPVLSHVEASMSDSLHAFGLPRLFLFGLPILLPERVGSLLSLTILSIHATPGHPGRLSRPRIPFGITVLLLRWKHSYLLYRINGAACGFTYIVPCLHFVLCISTGHLSL